ncbi:hypothetical protein BCD49_13705 [Pseudofrankia sp. EUN1h]|nr:hypothetical protein BCD49_13705 [Pseudofrankia sp. EUN1h]
MCAALSPFWFEFWLAASAWPWLSRSSAFCWLIGVSFAVLFWVPSFWATESAWLSAFDLA